MNFYVIILILIIFIIFLINSIPIDSKIVSNCVFLSKLETFDYLKSDPDNFYKSLKQKDLELRNVKNIDEYIRRIAKSVDDFTIDEKNKLLKAVNDADDYLHNINIPGFDGLKCKNIEWKIGCIIGKDYEAGLPHTRGELILFPRYKLMEPTKIFTRTLIHERIHIYQKVYPDDMKIYLKQYGYKRYKPVHKSKTRANPDIDNWTYTDKNGEIMSAEYIKNAKTIRDVIFRPKNRYEYEHPFEKIAIDISDGF